MKKCVSLIAIVLPALAVQASATESQCFGIVSKGRIEGSVKLPASGPNFSARHALREGDCLAMQLDRPTMFHNPTRKPARYAVVIASETSGKR